LCHIQPLTGKDCQVMVEQSQAGKEVNENKLGSPA
jgi:hypothetical protein